MVSAADHSEQPARPDSEPAPVDVSRTTTAIVGGGPAGAVLALLLARRGIPVTLLEAHHDFDRDFRGDTLHPSVLEVMDELGLADRLLQLPHAKIPRMTFDGAAGPVTIADFGRLKTRFPFVTMMPQARFLDFIVAEAGRRPSFRLVLGARVEELVEAGGRVEGVRYRADDGRHEVRALLTVGADGRFSRVRHLAGLEPVRAAPAIDVLWFRLPRRPDDPRGAGVLVRIARGHVAGMLEREDDWQVAYVIPKGGYQRVRAAGLEALRRSLAALLPAYADRLAHLTDWHQVSLLSVESSRVRRWYKPGLLLIGDAAHVMSPIGGVGINYAIMDAVAASNILGGPLAAGRLGVADLAAVQRRRELPVKVVQAFQGLLQERVMRGVLADDRPFELPAVMRLLPRIPLLRGLPARFVGFGLRPEHVRRDVC